MPGVAYAEQEARVGSALAEGGLHGRTGRFPESREVGLSVPECICN